VNTTRTIFRLFVVAGVVLVAVASAIIQHTRSFRAHSIAVPGVVIANDLSGRGVCFPRVRFETLEGRQIIFRSNSGSRPPAYAINEKVTVYYDPANPARPQISGFFSTWGGSSITGGIGIIFCLVGGLPLLLSGRAARREQQLRSIGMRIQTDFDRVEYNPNVRVNGRSPWRIVSRGVDPATCQPILFKSARIWFDPTPYVQGKSIEVIVDPHDYTRYVVETGFLPRWN